MTNVVGDTDLGTVTGGWDSANGSYQDYGSHILYTVAPGDYLLAIALRFDVNYQSIAKWNSLQDPNRISIGQQLIIYPNVRR